MKQLINRLFLVLVLVTSAYGQTVEIKKMNEILGEVTPGAIVIFDLDNTIMEAGQTLGSDQWFDHRIGQLKNLGFAPENAVKQAVQEWMQINYRGKVQLVEKETPQIVRDLHHRDIPTMGLTARPADFSQKSLSQLQELNVPLSSYTISEEEHEFQDKDRALYEEGLLSVGGNNKGTILVKLLAEVGLTPERILFVDDKTKNVKNVEEALATIQMPYFGFRYAAADPKVASFDKKLAEFEFGYFLDNGVVLTDAEAKKLMP